MLLLFLWISTTIITAWLFLEITVPQKLLIQIIRKKSLDLSQRLVIFAFLLIFLMIIMIISESLLSNETELYIEYIVLLLAILSLSSIFILILFFGIKFLIENIRFILNNVSSLRDTRSKENKFKVILIGLSILSIIIMPVILFAIIYSFFIAILSSHANFTNLPTIHYIYYAMTISYSLPDDAIVRWVQYELSKNGFLKIIPSIQVIIQKIIDIFLLGFLATIITDNVLNTKDNPKRL